MVRVLIVNFDKDVPDTVHDVLATLVGRRNVTDASTMEIALGFLARWPEGVVVVCGNKHADHHLAAAFFAGVVADPPVAERHQYILLSSEPMRIPHELYAHLRQLNAAILPKPVGSDVLIARVHAAAVRLTRHARQPNGGAVTVARWTQA